MKIDIFKFLLILVIITLFTGCGIFRYRLSAEELLDPNKVQRTPDGGFMFGYGGIYKSNPIPDYSKDRQQRDRDYRYKKGQKPSRR